jgi:two-component system secretion response regulator SsrB
MATPTILIVDDHPGKLLGISDKLKNIGLENIFQASGYDEIPASINRGQPDIIILGDRLHNTFTLELVCQIRNSFPELKIIILGSCHHEVIVWSFLKLGIRGYILKENAQVNIAYAVTSVINGEVWFSPLITEKIINKVSEINELSCLSQRELTIIQMLSQGKKEVDIARTLKLSERTIRYSLKLIYKKINVNTKIQAVYWAATEGIL